MEQSKTKMDKDANELCSSILLSIMPNFTATEEEYREIINVIEMMKKITKDELSEFQSKILERAIYYKFLGTEEEKSMNAIGKHTPKQLRDLLFAEFNFTDPNPTLFGYRNKENIEKIPTLSPVFFELITTYLGYQITRFVNLRDFWMLLYSINNPIIGNEYHGFVYYISKKIQILEKLHMKLELLYREFPLEYRLFGEAIERTRPNSNHVDFRKPIMAKLKLGVKTWKIIRNQQMEAAFEKINQKNGEKTEINDELFE